MHKSYKSTVPFCIEYEYKAKAVTMASKRNRYVYDTLHASMYTSIVTVSHCYAGSILNVSKIANLDVLR